MGLLCPQNHGAQCPHSWSTKQAKHTQAPNNHMFPKLSVMALQVYRYVCLFIWFFHSVPSYLTSTRSALVEKRRGKSMPGHSICAGLEFGGGEFGVCGWNLTTRWAPTSYKLNYNPYNWPYKWVNGVITLLIRVINPFITGRGPPCRWWLQIFYMFTPTWGRFPFWILTHIFSNWLVQPSTSRCLQEPEVA